MSVVFGKPGTLRYRGRLRAQMQRTVVLIGDILAYNQKLRNRVPPITVFADADAVSFAATSITLQGYIAEKN